VLERISSVLVDELSDSTDVHVDSKGFHPSTVTVQKGSSVLWSWKESGDEAHSITHINPPNSSVSTTRILTSASVSYMPHTSEPKWHSLQLMRFIVM